MPGQLLGDWFLPPPAIEDAVGIACPSPPTSSNCSYKLTLAPTSYGTAFKDANFIGGSKGDVAVNTSEIDVFNEVGGHGECPGVGRYTWSITGGILAFTLISDPCQPRSGLFTERGWSRTG